MGSGSGRMVAGMILIEVMGTIVAVAVVVQVPVAE